MADPKPVSSMSFEDALAELETIVRSLETGQAALGDSIAAYERGTALKKHCDMMLRDAREKIEKITVGENGTLSSQPFEQAE